MQNLSLSAGMRFRQAVLSEKPLQIVGTINAFTALLAQKVGFKAIYLSGAGVANASFGLPDLGMTTLSEVLEDTRRITSAVDTPLLIDIDTGWGGAFVIGRTIREFIKAGAAGIHLEDQVSAKRCGHRPNKKIVTTAEMVDRLKAAVDSRTDASFVIIARTDALACEGLSSVITRAREYHKAGADMIFLEGVQKLEEYSQLIKACNIPLLANITEFGITPLFTKEELGEAGVSLILYPLTAFRAMNAAAYHVYREIRQDGTQKNLLDTLQTREELYDILHYHYYEDKLDQLFSQGKES